MDIKEYKTYHERHMTNNTGTSLSECMALLSVIPFYAFLSSFLSSYIGKPTSCVFHFLLIILPVILNLTVLSDVNPIVFLTLAVLSTVLITVKTGVNNFKNFLNMEYAGRKSFISNYRACLNFLTAICIFAVDFIVFPKRFAKTESFGFGFMDLGVGCFICSNAFVEKHSITRGQFFKFLKTVLILCALGVIRLLSVKLIDYHEHVSEYGVHWNFFFTLALCQFLSHFVILFTKDAITPYLSIITGLLHEVLLLSGLQDWVLSNEPRDSFLSANREGLVSALGYVTLYFAASAIGKSITKNLTYRKLFIKLLLMSIISWTGIALSLKTVGVSRRLCNAGYIFWILATSLTALVLFLVVEIALKTLKRRKDINNFYTEPTLLQSINGQGLFYFLFGNLLTGLVNSIFQTLLLGKSISMMLIVSYMIILCTATHVLHTKKFIFISK